MMKCFLLLTSINQICFANQSVGNSTDINIEHQIRLCDSAANIKMALNKYQTESKKMEVYYLETPGLLLSKNQLSIRLREKENKLEVTVKKRMSSISETSKTNDSRVCEYDLHGGVKELACKIDRDATLQDFADFKNGKITSEKLLNKAQLNLIGNIDLPDELNLYGTLSDERISIQDITVDLVLVKKHENVSYHEISKRYPVTEENSTGITFDAFVRGLNLKFCSNQLDWDVPKYQILDIIK